MDDEHLWPVQQRRTFLFFLKGRRTRQPCLQVQGQTSHSMCLSTSNVNEDPEVADFAQFLALVDDVALEHLVKGVVEWEQAKELPAVSDWRESCTDANGKIDEARMLNKISKFYRGALRVCSPYLTTLFLSLLTAHAGGGKTQKRQGKAVFSRQMVPGNQPFHHSRLLFLQDENLQQARKQQTDGNRMR